MEQTENKYYDILKAELESSNLHSFVEAELRKEDGYFYEVYDRRVIKILSVITYVKKNPDNYKEAWERWAKEQNIKLSEEEKKDKLSNNGFVWDENKLILKKVFPTDIHKNIFFYGLLLPKIVDNLDSKGRVLGKKQKLMPCLITSKSEQLEVNERLKEDLQIDFENIPTSLPHRWRLDDIKKYLIGESKKVNGKELLEKIKNQYESYVFIRNKTWYKILSVWDIGTYLYVIFEAYPFIENRGIAGTGKTKDMTVSSFISFNGGQIMVNPTESTLFRETDEVRGTKYFDEAEKLWIYNKQTKQYEGDVRTELINASYTKEGRVPRQEKIGNKFVTKWYSPYSPTRLSSINGLFGATETRAITRITTKSPDDDNRGEKEPSEDRNLSIWNEIRDECYRFALENWDSIKEIYNNFPKDIGLKRRDYQIWKPILAIVKFISEEDYLEILEFAEEITNQRLDDLVPESSFDYMCLSALKETINNHPDTEKIYVGWIKNTYCEQKGDTQGLDNIYLNRNISTHLDKLGFKEFRGRDNQASYFAITKTIFDEIVSPICPKLAFISTSSTLSTPLHINDNKISGDKVGICVDNKKEKVAMVAISGESVDTYRVEEPLKSSEQKEKPIFNPNKINEMQESYLKKTNSKILVEAKNE